MRWLYSFGIFGYGLLVWLVSPFNKKAKQWSVGRKGGMKKIAHTIDQNQQHIWFHFASLGEFEQGRAVLENIKRKYPTEKIIITFFSPSGYEIRKNSNLADYVFYLPQDSLSNARKFIELINPKFAVFTKYEYWYYYFRELYARKIPLLMISAIFRREQLFFKSYGNFYRQILKYVDFFFAQNIQSIYLLKSIGITNAGLAGDTRFDRVIELPRQATSVSQVEQFMGKQPLLVAGSTWLPDEELIATLLTKHSAWKCVLVPHEIHEEHIQKIIQLFPSTIRFSEYATYSAEQTQQAQVLIIDNIGLLSSLYRYADISYIGGGFGVGIHNTLEAVTYGVPVIFGPKYEKYQEAIALVEIGVGFSISDQLDLDRVFTSLSDNDKRIQIGVSAKKFVQQQSGATQIIMKYIETERLLP